MFFYFETRKGTIVPFFEPGTRNDYYFFNKLDVKVNLNSFFKETCQAHCYTLIKLLAIMKKFIQYNTILNLEKDQIHILPAFVVYNYNRL